MTVVIWDEVDTGIKFFVTDKPVEDLNRKYINSCDTSTVETNRISDLVYDQDGHDNVEMSEVFPIEAVKAGASVVVLGFLP